MGGRRAALAQLTVRQPLHRFGTPLAGAPAFANVANNNSRLGMYIFCALRAAQRQEFAERFGEAISLRVKTTNAHGRCFP